MSQPGEKTKSRFDSLKWTPVSINSNLMLTRANDFSGLLSFEVVDGGVLKNAVYSSGSVDKAEEKSAESGKKKGEGAKQKGSQQKQQESQVGSKRKQPVEGTSTPAAEQSKKKINAQQNQKEKQQQQQQSSGNNGKGKASKQVKDQETDDDDDPFEDQEEALARLSGKKAAGKASGSKENGKSKKQQKAEAEEKIPFDKELGGQFHDDEEDEVDEDGDDDFMNLIDADEDAEEDEDGEMYGFPMEEDEDAYMDMEDEDMEGYMMSQDEDEDEDEDEHLEAFNEEDAELEGVEMDEDEDGELEFEEVDEKEVDTAIPETLRRAAANTTQEKDNNNKGKKAANEETKQKSEDEKKNKKDDGKKVAEPAPATSPAAAAAEPELPPLTDEEVEDWKPYDLHPLLLQGIKAMRFRSPTPIQAACILPSYRDWKDVVGAAQTGSGKTLAFGLPILQAIMQNRERAADAAEAAAASAAEKAMKNLVPNSKAYKKAAIAATDAMQHARTKGLMSNRDPLTALVLTPTRELALQIVTHLTTVAKFANIRAVAVVGGLAKEKQERLLSRQPGIVVATPGRLWELIAAGCEAFNSLHALRFFVLDEADRMVANGSFPELNNIISYVQSFRDPVLNAKSIEMEGGGGGGLTPLLANALNSARAATDNAQGKGKGKGKKNKKTAAKQQAADEEDKDENEDQDQEQEEGEDRATKTIRDSALDEQDLMSTASLPLVSSTNSMPLGMKLPKRMQVVLFSATLTIKDEGRGRRKKTMPNKFKRKLGKDGKEEDEEKEGPGRSMILALAERLPFEGKPHVVDFSSRLVMAEGIEQYYLECLDEERDYYLYSQLYDFPGRVLVFVNSVMIVRKLVNILKELNLPVQALHAQKIQRQRLKTLERFRANPRGIIVCTDVAARGIDIPKVDLVIHFHVAMSPELYVHRSGRTARAGTTGRSVLMLGPKDLPELMRLKEVLGPIGAQALLPMRVNTHVIKLVSSVSAYHPFFMTRFLLLSLRVSYLCVFNASISHPQHTYFSFLYFLLPPPSCSARLV